MDAMLDPTALQTLWFGLIAFFFLAYFVLEGFDFGVQMNVATFWRRGSRTRGTVLETVGPVWDGNEVFLITGGALLFAAFPEWYATLFSGFYLALLLLLLVLIVRVCAFKWRSKVDSERWRTSWDIVHVIGGFAPALLWGVAFGNIVAGVGIDENHWVTTSMLGLLNPFALLGGLVFVLLFWLHGTLYLALKVTGTLREDANRLAGILVWPTILAGAAFLLWYQLAHSHAGWTWIPLVLAALALVAVVPLNRLRREGLAFTATTTAISGAVGHPVRRAVPLCAAVDRRPRQLPDRRQCVLHRAHPHRDAGGAVHPAAARARVHRLGVSRVPSSPQRRGRPDARLRAAGEGQEGLPRGVRAGVRDGIR